MLPLGRWVVVSVHLLVPVHWHTAINRLVLRMRCEHPVVSGVRVRLVVVDLDLLRRHALYALHCKGVCFGQELWCTIVTVYSKEDVVSDKVV